MSMRQEQEEEGEDDEACLSNNYIETKWSSICPWSFQKNLFWTQTAVFSHD